MQDLTDERKPRNKKDRRETGRENGAENKELQIAGKH